MKGVPLVPGPKQFAFFDLLQRKLELEITTVCQTLQKSTLIDPRSLCVPRSEGLAVNSPVREGGVDTTVTA